MSYSRKRAGGRSFSKQGRGGWRSHAQPIKLRQEQSKGTVFSTLFGLGIAMVLVLGLALMVIIGHESNADLPVVEYSHPGRKSQGSMKWLDDLVVVQLGLCFTAALAAIAVGVVSGADWIR